MRDVRDLLFLVRVDSSAPIRWIAKADTVDGIGYRLTSDRLQACKMTSLRAKYAARSLRVESYSLETTEN